VVRLLQGPFSIEALWLFLIGPPHKRECGQCLVDSRANESAGPEDLSRKQFAALRDSAQHVWTWATFSRHACNGPATSSDIRCCFICLGYTISESLFLSWEGPSGPPGLSCNRGWVLFKWTLTAHIWKRQHWRAKQEHVRCRWN